jgi:hypothetical protein
LQSGAAAIFIEKDAVHESAIKPREAGNAVANEDFWRLCAQTARNRI